MTDREEVPDGTRKVVSFAFTLMLGGMGAGPASAARHERPLTVRVGGDLAAPLTYSRSQLHALPQTTFSIDQRSGPRSRIETDQGVAVEELVNASRPTLPNAKNALLRVTVTVGGAEGRQVTFALGELNPSFGHHPAYLALNQDGRALPAPVLVVPADTNNARTISGVTRVTVDVHNRTPTTPPASGSLTIEARGSVRVLGADLLAALPAQVLRVTFQAGMGPQQHTEAGPLLDTVLRAAHVREDRSTWVAAVGSDGYIAVVTPAEARVGGRPLQISLREDDQPLAQPRLVVDGDIKGGRYVSDVVDLVVGEALAPDTPSRRRAVASGTGLTPRDPGRVFVLRWGTRAAVPER